MDVTSLAVCCHLFHAAYRFFIHAKSQYRKLYSLCSITGYELLIIPVAYILFGKLAVGGQDDLIVVSGVAITNKECKFAILL